ICRCQMRIKSRPLSVRRHLRSSYAGKLPHDAGSRWLGGLDLLLDYAQRFKIVWQSNVRPADLDGLHVRPLLDTARPVDDAVALGIDHGLAYSRRRRAAVDPADCLQVAIMMMAQAAGQPRDHH